MSICVFLGSGKRQLTKLVLCTIYTEDISTRMSVPPVLDRLRPGQELVYGAIPANAKSAQAQPSGGGDYRVGLIVGHGRI